MWRTAPLIATPHQDDYDHDSQVFQGLRQHSNEGSILSF